MSGTSSSPEQGNVVSLAAFRRQLQARVEGSDTADAGSGCTANPSAAPDTVFFVTAGRFEWMVNGSVSTVRQGEFIRVPAGATHNYRNLAALGGSMLSHRFPGGLHAGLYRELAAALPLFATRLPARGTRLYRQLQAIARRWGIELESGAAA